MPAEKRFRSYPRQVSSGWSIDQRLCHRCEPAVSYPIPPFRLPFRITSSSLFRKNVPNFTAQTVRNAPRHAIQLIMKWWHFQCVNCFLNWFKNYHLLKVHPKILVLKMLHRLNSPKLLLNKISNRFYSNFQHVAHPRRRRKSGFPSNEWVRETVMGTWKSRIHWAGHVGKVRSIGLDRLLALLTTGEHRMSSRDTEEKKTTTGSILVILSSGEWRISKQ